MNVWNWVKQTPLWLVVPSMFISVGVASAVARYEPLVFDPSLYEAQTVDAAELSIVDAEALEAANAAGGEAADVQLDAPSSGVGADGALADGSWTGYAACGKGNADNWKPYYVGVTVEVSGGKPQGVTRIFGASSGNAGDAALSWDADENQKYLDWAILGRNGAQGVKAQLAGESVVSDVDTVSGATYSSAAIFNAYVDALGKSAKAAGGASPVAARAEPSGSSKAAGKGGKLKSKKKIGVLADGSWTGYAKCGPDPDESWKPYYVGVTLTVKDGKLASIDRVFGSSTGEKGSKKLTYDADENAQYLESAEYGVVAQLEKALSAGKIPSSIDTVSGATFSSKSIYEAYYAALEKSAAEAGSAVATSDEQPAQQEPAQQEQPADGAGEIAAEGESFYGFALCGNASGNSDSWDPYYLFVEVKAQGGAVTGVVRAYADSEGLVDPNVVYVSSQNELYLNWAIDGKFGGTGYRMRSVVAQIQEKIASGAAVEGISTVSGATRSSRAIVEAYEMAAENAAAGVGRTAEEAVAARSGAAEGSVASEGALVPGVLAAMSGGTDGTDGTLGKVPCASS